MKKSFLKLMLIMIMFVSGTACAHTEQIGSVAENSPATFVPEQFLGTWEGSWPNGRYYSITIKKINSAKKVYGIYEWGSTIKNPSGSRKIKGEVRGRTFELFYGSVTLTLTPSDNGKIAAVTWSKIVPNGIEPTIYSNAWKK